MWTADNENLIINLNIRDGAGLELVRVRCDGTDIQSIAPGIRTSFDA